MSVISEPGVQVPTEEEIRRALAHVLSSPVFRGSKRCCDFANYVCTKVLEGAADTLKERTLAVEVFGRRSSEDLADDNIVRVGAREVRSRLALYYTGEGVQDAVRIELPTGSYVPIFSYRSEKTQTLVAPLPMEAAPVIPASTTPPEVKTSIRYSGRWIVAAAAVVLVICSLVLIPSRHATSSFETFWKPAFDFPAPVLLVMAHPIVYHPSSRALLLDMQVNGKPDLAISRALNLPPARLDGSDFVPVFNQYVGFGDAVAAVNAYSVFANRGIIPQLRLADKLEFNDFYGSTVILIGGSFANRWTAEMTKGLRYQFRFEDQSKPWIVDSQSEQKWGLASITEDRRTTEDYILLCRMPQAQTGKLMVIVAGLTGFGTEAGGRILSDAKSLEPLLRKLPKDWAGHNLEMVMKVEVVGEGPALPSLVATHVW